MRHLIHKLKHETHETLLVLQYNTYSYIYVLYYVTILVIVILRIWSSVQSWIRYFSHLFFIEQLIFFYWHHGYFLELEHWPLRHHLIYAIMDTKLRIASPLFSKPQKQMYFGWIQSSSNSFFSFICQKQKACYIFSAIVFNLKTHFEYNPPDKLITTF